MNSWTGIMIAVGFVAITTVGCLETHETKLSSSLTIDDQALLAQDCELLDKLGILQEVKTQIYSDTDRIIELTSRENVPRYLSEIERLGQRVHENVTTLKALLDPKWSDLKWQQNLKWSFALGGNLTPVKISVEKVILNGVAIPALTKSVKVWKKNDRVYIGLDKKSSSLEICELKNTFGIYLQVTEGSLIQFTSHHRLTIN